MKLPLATLSVALLAVSAFVWPLSASACIVAPDTNYTNAVEHIGRNDPVQIYEAMPFTATCSGTLNTVTVGLSNDGNTFSGAHILMELHADSSGVPNTTILASASILQTSLTSSLASTLFTYSSGTLTITNGTKYWIVYTADTSGSGVGTLAGVGGTNPGNAVGFACVGTSGVVGSTACTGNWASEGRDYALSVDITASAAASVFAPLSYAYWF